MQKQLQQMQAMQRKMEMMQAEIEEKEVTTTAGGGAVTVTVSGKKELTKLEIKPEVVDADDVEMLQDLIMVAVNEGLRQDRRDFKCGNEQNNRRTGNTGTLKGQEYGTQGVEDETIS